MDIEYQLSILLWWFVAGEILSLQIFKYYVIFLSLSGHSFVFLFALCFTSLIIFPYHPFLLPSLSFFIYHVSFWLLYFFLVILLCTHYFSRANLLPGMERTVYLKERNFALWNCSGQISSQLLIGQDRVGSVLFWMKLSSRSRAT